MKNKNKKITPKLIFSMFFIIVLLIIILKGASSFIEYRAISNPLNDNINYPVRGVDVSHYQGDISWDILSEQISFAFIKATEGSSHVDKKFDYNWEEAQKTNLKIGAYHFMSFESSGETQAKNFINNVPKVKGMLPPVIDLEYYGEFLYIHPSKYTVDKILRPLIDTLESHYNMKPIIYTNKSCYNSYIKDTYDNDIWLSDLSLPDSLPDNKPWEFLQYTFDGKLDGYSGYMPNIDLNVYNGSKLDFIKKY